MALATSVVPAGAQLIRDPEMAGKIERQLKLQQEIAARRDEAMFGVLRQELSYDERQAVKYLLAFMPLSDLADYSGGFFLENARVALKARREMPWGKDIPEDIFLHFVLPPRVNNENLDSFRLVMYEELKARLKGLSMKQAALEVNHWCHEKVTYKGSDERTSGPLSTIRYSYGRCGEESTFFVAALRMAGIPARQVYTSRWAHTDDNHAWVEVWVDGKWSFLGACEPSPDLNMGWFAVPSTRTMNVNTRAFGWYNGPEPCTVREDRFAELNLIGNYTPSKTLFVKVTDSAGTPVKDSKVEYRLYNYSEFFPLAKVWTNKEGISSFLTGMGDLMIWAGKGSSFGYGKARVPEIDTVTIVLGTKAKYGTTEEFDFVPPPEGKPATASEEGMRENNRRLLVEDSIRAVYMKTFKDSAWAVDFAKQMGTNPDSTAKSVVMSYGNWREITSFIKNTKPELRAISLKLLSAVSEKDLRDARAEILSEHLEYAMSHYPADAAQVDTWTNYVLNPRISYEMLGKWRKLISENMFTKKDARVGEIRPETILKWVNENIKIDTIANMHSRAPLTPAGVFNLRVADAKSREIFFVAACRAFGLPARLNPETLVPQYLEGDAWKNANFGTAQKINEAMGIVHFKNLGSFDPKYYINYTIALFRGGVYNTMEFDWGKPLSEFGNVSVPEGDYMLVTGNRRPDGSVLSSITFFEVKSGETKEVDVKVRDIVTENKPFGELNLSGLEVQRYARAEKEKLAQLTGGKPFILAIIEPDKEPTKHVMADLQPVKADLEKWGGNVIFILEHGRAPENFKPQIFGGLPENTIYAWDTPAGDMMKKLGELRGKDLTASLPAIVTGDASGKLYFFSSGYTIGIGDMIVKKVK